MIGWARRAVASAALVLTVVVAVLESAWVVLRLAFARRVPRAAMIEYRLRARREATIGWLSHLVTLTPGSLGVGLTDDGRALFVHVLDGDGLDDARRGVRLLEDRLIAVFEPEEVR
ncbi:Na+/H+ antiporter subunit E [Myxococcota bacterium]|nr:Na+/H+ antiporter subunit E [Myxococcota bacterium]